jgi:hypothetical protein
MYEDKYCAMRLRGIKTEGKLERGLWGDTKGTYWGDKDRHELWWK